MRMFSGVLVMIVAVTAVSLYAFWRVDRVQRNVQLVNQFYVPTLKHLNVLLGKWSAYQRAFEQSVAFRKWGSLANVSVPKLYLGKMVEWNLGELRKILDQPGVGQVAELERLETWMAQITAVANREPLIRLELETLLKAKRFSDAASVYSAARHENLRVSQELTDLVREVENQVSLIQLSTEQELRSSQSVMVLLLGLSVLISLIVLLRLQRWFGPISEWIRVAQEIALKGLSRNIRFPRVGAGMPPELSLLTREFTRMGMTVLERERTIRTQRDKLESLNGHLKEQNEILRKLGALNERVLNGMSSGLLVISRDGLIEQFNERYCELFAGDRASLFGFSAREALRTWPEALVSKWLNEPLNADAPLLFSRISFGHRIFDVRVHALQAQDGRLMLFEDVTQVVETEERLEHAKKLVLAGNLSSQVAHEVRNPLNSMSLQLEMLREDVEARTGGEPRSTARINAIEEQVQRLERITRRYLDIGRGPLKGEGAPVDLHGVIEKTLTFLSGELQAGRIAVETQLDAGSPTVTGDADALYQVVFNLVKNAIEAMKDTPSTAKRVLSIRTFQGDGANPSVCMRVSDTGPGISQTLQGRLFEPFATNKADGHGLGLSVSRQVCIEHGGELRVAADAGNTGAVFEMVIPVNRAEGELHA